MASYCLKVLLVCSASSTLLVLFYRPMVQSKNNYLIKTYEGKSCRMERLNDILLAVNFNSPHFNNIPLLKEYYGPIFGKIVFCSAKGDRKYDVIEIGGTVKGWLGYNCITQAMKLYPGYQGYMHTNDDVVINWWNLLDFDQTKIWTGQDFISLRSHSDHFQELNKPLIEWWWWRKIKNADACGEILTYIESLKNNIDQQGQLFEILLNNFNELSNDRKGCFIMWSDVFYIPHEKKEAFIRISDIFVQYNIFLEMAVPTILAFLIERKPDKNWDVLSLNGSYLPDTYGWNVKYRHGIAFYETYTFDLNFIHPIKFGGSRMTVANKNMFKNVIMRYGNDLRVKCKEKN